MIEESALPQAIGQFEAVEMAYPVELSRCEDAIQRSLPVMITCDKELTPFFYKCLRDRLTRLSLRCVYLDGRTPNTDSAQEATTTPPSMVSQLIGQLHSVVRGSVERVVVVVPHLDLLTSSSRGLSPEAREVIPLLYENPYLLWIGFKDPSFVLPKVIENLFPQQEVLVGIRRERLPYLVTQSESRKFGHNFDLYTLYKYVSGVNAVRLRRLLSSIQGEDYPIDPSPAYRQLRTATIGLQLSIPELDLHTDIGGYNRVKQRLQEEILDIITYKETLDDHTAIGRLERLVPKGMIFSGPPGTGKTLFAKAMASALGAAITIVSGPELKSRWVGESEEMIRQLFFRARESAPSVIVFDELDSFAAARGTYTGSGVEHSMVNQLLTEMDGFRQEEMVFVVGTTNFVESIDPALLRPGRFEFQLNIPYPNPNDRRAIWAIYNKQLDLQFSEETLDYAVKLSGGLVDRTHTPYSGDHIQGLCRAIARYRLRHQWDGVSEPEHIDAVLAQYMEHTSLTDHEEMVIATHEAGHAVCAMGCDQAMNIEHISIRMDIGDSLGSVRYSDPANRYVLSQAQLLDMICMLMGGREAEQLLLGELSIGSAQDIDRATAIATSLVTEYGMGELVGPRYFDPSTRHQRSATMQQLIDDNINAILQQQRQHAIAILQQQQASLEALRDLLITNKKINKNELKTISQEINRRKSNE